MADEHQFIENGLQRSQIDEFFAEELGRAGYGGMDVAKTPMGTQIVLKAEKPGMVIGKGGKNIRKVTRELEERFNLDDPQIDVQEVDEPDLNARIVADRLANALERGWYFRKAGHTTIDRIMEPAHSAPKSSSPARSRALAPASRSSTAATSSTTASPQRRSSTAASASP